MPRKTIVARLDALEASYPLAEAKRLAAQNVPFRDWPDRAFDAYYAHLWATDRASMERLAAMTEEDLDALARRVTDN